jgi:hypothetical protein
MSDRLSELQRQRALAQEQVAWFDREIAREQSRTPAAFSPLPAAAAPSPVAPATAAPANNPASSADTDLDRKAEEILKRFKHAEHPVRNEVRRGCFLYFFSAFALLALALLAFYLLHQQPE